MTRTHAYTASLAAEVEHRKRVQRHTAAVRRTQSQQANCKEDCVDSNMHRHSHGRRHTHKPVYQAHTLIPHSMFCTVEHRHSRIRNQHTRSSSNQLLSATTSTWTRPKAECLLLCAPPLACDNCNQSRRNNAECVVSSNAMRRRVRNLVAAARVFVRVMTHHTVRQAASLCHAADLFLGCPRLTGPPQ